MNQHPKMVSDFHEAGHAVALLAAGHDLSSFPLPVLGSRSGASKPWYASAKVFDWTFPPEAKDRLEAMKNQVQHHAIVAMAGPVAEAQHTGRNLTEILASRAGTEDDRYLHTIGHTLYGPDFGRFRAEALDAADEILSGKPWHGLMFRLSEVFRRTREPNFHRQHPATFPKMTVR